GQQDDSHNDWTYETGSAQEQQTPWPGTRLFVAPNPSGLNAHATLDSLAADYRAAGAAAGLVD
ncbi:hypothetical protein M3D92_08540, partial [Micrococcus terreus]|nr:hypothetical protein [Micrococcus terreus]